MSSGHLTRALASLSHDYRLDTGSITEHRALILKPNQAVLIGFAVAVAVFLVATGALIYARRYWSQDHNGRYLTWRQPRSSLDPDLERGKTAIGRRFGRSPRINLGERLSVMWPISLCWSRAKSQRRELLAPKTPKRRWRVVHGKLVSVRMP